MHPISTHALTWSATRCSRCSSDGRYGDFNSRTHVECDAIFYAPLSVAGNFNSRTHVECDGCAPTRKSEHRNFNSRTHVECDANETCFNYGSVHFNSRTHVECDCTKNSWRCQPRISTHALTWSATGQMSLSGDVEEFQLTHSRGVRHWID